MPYFIGRKSEKKKPEKESNDQPPASDKVPSPQSQSIPYSFKSEKGHPAGDKKFSVKFSIQGGKLFTPASEPQPVEEKTVVSSSAVTQTSPQATPQAPEATPQTPQAMPQAPQPGPVTNPPRILYCPTCNQYYEVAETDLRADLTCSTCNNLLQVTLTCTSCNGMLSLDVDTFLKGKNMQAPCPDCGNTVLIR